MTHSILYSNHHPKLELSSQYPCEDVSYLIDIYWQVAHYIPRYQVLVSESLHCRSV